MVLWIYNQNITKLNIIYQVLCLNIIYLFKQKYNCIHVLVCWRFPGLSPQNFQPLPLVMGWGYTLDGVWHVHIILRITEGWTSLEEEEKQEDRHTPCFRKKKYTHSKRNIFHYFSFLPNSPYISSHNQKYRLSYDETKMWYRKMYF